MATEMQPGDPVRLLEPAAGMSKGAMGLLLGWYRNDEEPEVLVNFWDGGPLRVPAHIIVLDD